MDRDNMQYRMIGMENIQTRDDDDTPRIEGYFSVYNSIYQITSDMSESIEAGAFSDSLGGDVRALINHDTTLVLGRTAAHTLELRDDSHGLWGSITVNRNDSDAMNLYERVKRGDVSGCSIGFAIIREETDIRDDDSVHFTIKQAELFEVSPCTFPAYKETTISARAAQRDEIRKRRADEWTKKQKARIQKWH